MEGRRALSRPIIEASFEGSLRDRADRRQDVRVQVTQAGNDWVARPTGEQGSGILTSMLFADGLMMVPEGMTEVDPGARLPVLMLTWPETTGEAQPGPGSGRW